MVFLAPRVKNVSINPGVIFAGNLNWKVSDWFPAEGLQDIFAGTDLCDGPSFTLVFAACAKSVGGLQNSLKDHFSREERGYTSRYA